ncbi:MULTISPECIES: hypothetical protein [unclassified Aureimonas]|uniref:hypothetical protein n=1 Tax=unclassified Aureimonas TaxID=2615206 RepID=UPI0006F2F6C1|nr:MULTISPECIES: hypothetical protein [unclassified Aureimonas]KQT57472.1 hypothetical protein ASG62_09135 [Aureimonas sp. Leaf427]KQT77152.1 hypothetical protein ASG54_13005 [Aureimonas sp. Leaf460]
MSVTFMTSNPKALLAKFKKAIDEKDVATWSYDGDGDFTHDTDQWRSKAWMRPELLSDRLNFSILAPKDGGMTKTVYGIYHGRLIECFLSHFDDAFVSGAATAKVSGKDSI